MALLSLSSDASIVYYFKKRLTEKYFVPLTISLSGTHTRKSKEKKVFLWLFARLIVPLTLRLRYSHSEKQRKKSFSLAFRSFNRTFAR